MAAKGKGIGLGVLVVAAVVLWYLMQDNSPAAALAADVAGGKQVQVPTFGTDNIIDAADAVASTGSLPLSLSTLGAGAGTTGF